MNTSLQSYADKISTREIFGIVIKILGLIFLISLITVGIRAIGEDNLRAAVQASGFFGPLLLFTFILLKAVIAPITGGGVLATSTIIFGAWTTFAIAFTAHLLGCTINYFLAQRYGRGFVSKILGKRVLKHIDNLEETLQKRFYIVVFLGIFVLDLIGYAAGFLRIPFKKFFIPLTITTILYIGLNVWFGELIYSLIDAVL